jgi:hypothetical protein
MRPARGRGPAFFKRVFDANDPAKNIKICCDFDGATPQM